MGFNNGYECGYDDGFADAMRRAGSAGGGSGGGSAAPGPRLDLEWTVWYVKAAGEAGGPPELDGVTFHGTPLTLSVEDLDPVIDLPAGLDLSTQIVNEQAEAAFMLSPGAASALGRCFEAGDWSSDGIRLRTEDEMGDAYTQLVPSFPGYDGDPIDEEGEHDSLSPSEIASISYRVLFVFGASGRWVARMRT